MCVLSAMARESVLVLLFVVELSWTLCVRAHVRLGRDKELVWSCLIQSCMA